MPADFFIFDVHSRPSGVLEQQFPSFRSKRVDAIVDKDDPFEKVKAEYKNKTSSRVWINESTPGRSVGEELRFYLTRPESEKKTPAGLPLNFDSVEDEIGFTFLTEALSFGSSYDRILEEKSRGKRGSRETVQFGLIAMFISGHPPHTAEHLLNQSSTHQISTTFDFPIHESQALDFASKGGVYKDVVGPLAPLAEGISKCMAEMGTLLRARQKNHLGELALQIFSLTKDRKLMSFARALAQALPITFGDEISGVPVLAKAQRVAVALHDRFPEKFPFVERNKMLGFADAYLVFALRKMGVLLLSADLAEKIDSELNIKLRVGDRDEHSLRVGALYALRHLTLNNVDTARACEWLVAKADQVVHQRIRMHLCDTYAY